MFPYAVSPLCSTQLLHLQTCFLFFVMAGLEFESLCVGVLLSLAFSTASSSEGSKEKKEQVLLLFFKSISYLCIQK